MNRTVRQLQFGHRIIGVQHVKLINSPDLHVTYIIVFDMLVIQKQVIVFYTLFHPLFCPDIPLKQFIKRNGTIEGIYAVHKILLELRFLFS